MHYCLSWLFCKRRRRVSSPLCSLSDEYPCARLHLRNSWMGVVYISGCVCVCGWRGVGFRDKSINGWLRLWEKLLPTRLYSIESLSARLHICLGEGGCGRGRGVSLCVYDCVCMCICVRGCARSWLCVVVGGFVCLCVFACVYHS